MLISPEFASCSFVIFAHAAILVSISEWKLCLWSPNWPKDGERKWKISQCLQILSEQFVLRFVEIVHCNRCSNWQKKHTMLEIWKFKYDILHDKSLDNIYCNISIKLKRSALRVVLIQSKMAIATLHSTLQCTNKCQLWWIWNDHL